MPREVDGGVGQRTARVGPQLDRDRVRRGPVGGQLGVRLDRGQVDHRPDARVGQVSLVELLGLEPALYQRGGRAVDHAVVSGIAVAWPAPCLAVTGLVAPVPLAQPQRYPRDLAPVGELGSEPQHGADRRLSALHRVVLLGVNVQDPEPGHRSEQHGLVVLAGHANQEAVRSLECGQLSVHAVASQLGGGQGLVRHQAVHARLARRHLAAASGVEHRAVHGGYGQRVRQRLLVQAEQVCRSSRDSEGQVGTAAPAVRGYVGIAAGQLHPDVYLVSEGDRASQRQAGRPGALRRGEHRGDDEAGMARIGAGMAVHVIQVAQGGRIRERGPGDVRSLAVADDRHRSRCRADRFPDRPGRTGVGSAQYAADGVEQAAACLVDDFWRQVFLVHRGHQAGHPL